MTEDFNPFGKIEVQTLRCSKCGYEWIPKDQNKLPGTCPDPKCRSKNWNKPKSYRKPYTWKNPEMRNSIRKPRNR